MDGGDRPPVATLHAPEPLASGRAQALGEDAAHHLRVLRARVGDVVRLRDGAGGIATAVVLKLARTGVTVEVTTTGSVERPHAIHLLAPVADRERMLWLAEKAAELELSSWRPVLWRRSRSVSPRGEGPMFQQKLRGRMLAAMLQSQGAWLPECFPDATVERAIAAAPEGSRLLLDPAGRPMLEATISAPVSVALGPEGGFEPAEREMLVNGAFVPVSLGATQLRFETAGVAALAIARAVLASGRGQSCCNNSDPLTSS